MEIKALVDYVLKVRSKNACISFYKLDISTFEDVRYQVEKNNLFVDKFIVSRNLLGELVKSCYQYFDLETTRDKILKGFLGYFLGCEVWSFVDAEDAVIAVASNLSLDDFEDESVKRGVAVGKKIQGEQKDMRDRIMAQVDNIEICISNLKDALLTTVKEK